MRAHVLNRPVLNVLTLIADSARITLDETLVNEAATALTGLGAMVGAPDWLKPGIACDLPFDLLATQQADASVKAVVGDKPIDLFAQAAEFRRKRLLIADMDSTIVTSETLDDLAEHAGLKDEIAAITARAMNGELDFESALRERVAMLKGMKADMLDPTARATKLTPGAKALVKTMRAGGAYTALVSGGFTFFTERIKRRCGFNTHMGNTLVIKRGKLTGEVSDPIVNRDGKLKTLLSLAGERRIPIAETLAVGDGANDLPMLKAAGLGVAFHAKPIVLAEAPAAVAHTDLTSLLYAQGYRDEDIVD